MKQRGITLIELMITVAVLAILASIAVPSFQEFIRNDRITKKTNEVFAAVMLMRSEAVRTGSKVTFCAAQTGPNDGAGPACTSSSKNYSDGVLIFIDRGTSTGSYTAADDELISYIPKLSGITMHGGNKSFTLSPRGVLDSASENLVLCDDDANIRGGKAIQISKLGRAEIKDVSAASLTCTATASS